MRQKAKDIWVYLEKHSSGAIRNESLKLIPMAEKMAERKKGQIHGIIISDDEYNSDLRQPADDAAAITRLINDNPPAAVLFADTFYAQELAPVLAQMNEAAFFGNCEMAAAYAGDGRSVYTQQAFGGSVRTKSVCSSQRLEVAVIQTGSIELPENADIPQKTHHLQPEDYSVKMRTCLIDEHPFDKTGEKLPEEANVIVAGGRGADGEAGFNLIRELADLLGGAVGASRVAVDKGWISKMHLIGQSGKTVKPDLYIDCGLSGSIQHITGMRDAKCIISINKDPKALIFNVSDYVVIGDLFEILPHLIKEIKKNN